MEISILKLKLLLLGIALIIMSFLNLWCISPFPSSFGMFVFGTYLLLTAGGED